MNSEFNGTLTSQFDFRIPFVFRELRQPNDEDSQRYLSAVIKFYEYFSQNLQAYFSPNWKSAKFLDNYEFCNDRIITKLSSQTIPISSSQGQLLRAIQTLFSHSLCQEQKQKSSVIFKLPLPYLPFENSNKEQISSPIESTSTDVLGLILNYCADDWQSIGRFAMTCKKFYRSVNNGQTLKKIFESHIPLFSTIVNPILRHNLLNATSFNPTRLDLPLNNLTDEDLMRISHQGSKLENIKLHGCSFKPETLAHFLKKCPQLQFFECQRWNVPNFDDYMAILSLHAPNLEHLKVIDCEMRDQALFALSIPQCRLHSFEFENSLGKGSLSDYGLVPFFHMTSKLESLTLIGCPKATSFSLTNLILTKTAANANANSNTNEFKGAQLKKLVFSYCNNYGEKLPTVLLKGCQNLNVLELSFPSSLVVKEKIKSNFVKFLHSCSKLQSLKLTHCATFTKNIMESINIMKPINIMELILKNCPNLTHLELYGHDLTNDFFSELAMCPQLKSLKLKPLKPFCFSRQNLMDLKQSCPKLEKLLLIDCLLDEEDLISYIESSKLTELKLTQCGTFGSPLLVALSQNCPRLEVLEIDILQNEHPQPFDDKSIAELALHCHSLKSFTLNSSSLNKKKFPWQITAHSLSHLAFNCPDLRQLTLSHLNLSIIPGDSSIQQALKTFTHRCLKIVHLGLPACQGPAEQILSLILAYSQQIQLLNLAHNPELNNQFYRELRVCSNLRFLCLGNTQIEDSSLNEILPSFPQLQYLDLRRDKAFISQTPKKFSPSRPSPFLHIKQNEDFKS